MILKKTTLFTALATFAAMLLLPLGIAGAQSFNPLDQACQDANTRNTELCQETQNLDDPLVGPNGVISRVVNILSIVTAIIAVIVIVISGIRMITSRGEPNTVATARNTIIYAGIGIAVVMMARTIIVLIADRL